ncbi:AraC family ligand binding domain-containing protein [Pseudomonas monteilii]
MSHYWRHPAVPHIEIRNVEDGRTFSHASHAHATFSIGAIMAGQSSYLNGQSVRHISAGSVVLMNPGVVHACNPLQGQPWAYRMFYVDAEWLASVQDEEGIGATKGFTPFVETHSTDPALFAGLDSDPARRCTRHAASCRADVLPATGGSAEDDPSPRGVRAQQDDSGCRSPDEASRPSRR